MKNVMKKHGHKIIIGSILLVALVLTFLWGGNSPAMYGRNGDAENVVVETTKPKKTARDVSTPLHTKTPEVEQTSIPIKNPKETAVEDNTHTSQDEEPLTAEEKVEIASEVAEENDEVIEGDEEYSQNQGMDIDTETGKDKYNTAPVPEGKPVPVEPSQTNVTKKELTCTLSVRCDTILNNINWLDVEKRELVPSDGVIFAQQEVVFYDGESVFNVLSREMKKNKIHMEFTNTPIYNSAYIEGINNLYEFDCGELSGWMYKVNDWFPNYGCSRYQLKQGDKVEWVYTCDLGVDVGGFYSSQKDE